jgi:hypothetical protein
MCLGVDFGSRVESSGGHGPRIYIPDLPKGLTVMFGSFSQDPSWGYLFL